MTNRSLFLPQEHKEIVSEHNTFSNDVVGVFAFSMGIASLSSKNAIALATVSFVFCSLWMTYKGLLIYPALRRVYKGVAWWKQIADGLIEHFIFLLGWGFVYLIGFGIVTIDTFSGWSLSEMFKTIGLGN